MNLRKLFLYFGLVLALLSGGSIYYLYHLQTKEVTILQVKSNLGYIIEPGTKMSGDLVEPKIVLKKDLPPDPVLPGSIGQDAPAIYASKYLYPSDPLLASKITEQPISYKQVGQSIVSVKPLDLGLMGLIQLNDRITLAAPNYLFTNVRVVGITDSSGNIISVIPQLNSIKNDKSMLSINSQTKNPDHLMLLVSKGDADILSKIPKDQLSITFESRPSIPDAK